MSCSGRLCTSKSHVSLIWHHVLLGASKAPKYSAYFYSHMVVVEAPLWNADVLTMCALCTLRDKAPFPAWGIIPTSHSMLPYDLITHLSIVMKLHPTHPPSWVLHCGNYIHMLLLAMHVTNHIITMPVLLLSSSPHSDDWDVMKLVQVSFHWVVFMHISQSPLKSVLHNIFSDCMTFLCYALGASWTATTQFIRLMGFYNGVPSGGQNGHCLTPSPLPFPPTPSFP